MKIKPWILPWRHSWQKVNTNWQEESYISSLLKVSCRQAGKSDTNICDDASGCMLSCLQTLLPISCSVGCRSTIRGSIFAVYHRFTAPLPTFNTRDRLESHFISGSAVSKKNVYVPCIKVFGFINVCICL